MNQVDDSSVRYDDQIVGETPAKTVIIVEGDAGRVHDLPEDWLRARVRGWMEFIESPDLSYWIGTYTPEGRWIFCSSSNDLWAPKPYRQSYAMDVCRHVNLHCANGGAWLVGWVRGGREFYLLYKDQDGDIQIPIECDKPFIALQKYTVYDWERHCNAAHSVWSEMKKNNELTDAQQVKRAQGERTSPQHLDEAPPIAI